MRDTVSTRPLERTREVPIERISKFHFKVWVHFVRSRICRAVCTSRQTRSTLTEKMRSDTPIGRLQSEEATCLEWLETLRCWRDL